MMALLLALLGVQALIISTDAIRPPPRLSPNGCPFGEELPDVSCGRGVDRQDCPDDYFCLVGRNDLAAICCPKGGARVCKRGKPLADVTCSDEEACPAEYECSEDGVCCTAPPPNDEVECDYMCAEIRDAVCGSNGKIYANQCVLEGESSCRGEDIQQVDFSLCSRPARLSPRPPRRRGRPNL